VVAKIEWHRGELFPRINFVATNSRLSAGKVVKVYNGRGDVENRIKEGKNTLRWDKTSCQRFEANHARLKVGVLAYNLLHMIRQFYSLGRGSEAVDGLADQAVDQGLCQSFLTRPVVVFSSGLGLFPIAPLSGGAGLGSLGSSTLKYLGSEG
jgi:hypothetical protein